MKAKPTDEQRKKIQREEKKERERRGQRRDGQKIKTKDSKTSLERFDTV